MHLAKAAGSFGGRHGPTQTPLSTVLHRNTWSRTQTSGPGAGSGGLPWRIVPNLPGGLADLGGGVADLGWRTGGFWRILADCGGGLADSGGHVWRTGGFLADFLADWRILADSRWRTGGLWRILADWRIPGGFPNLARDA